MVLTLFFTRIDVFGGAVIAAVLANVFLIGLFGVHAVTDILEHLAELDELVAGDLVVFIQSQRNDIAFGLSLIHI